MDFVVSFLSLFHKEVDQLLKMRQWTNIKKKKFEKEKEKRTKKVEKEIFALDIIVVVITE